MAAAEKRRRRPDKRVARTRKAIMNAFDKLVSASDIDKITVSAIAREAGIDRKTFYLHFDSVGDLANRKASDAIAQVLEALEREGTGKPRTERVHIALSEVNAILTANVRVYANIASRLSVDQLLDQLEQVGIETLVRSELTGDVEGEDELHSRLQFYIAGSLSLYASWLRSTRATPIETVSATVEGVIASAWRSGPSTS